MPSPFPGVDPYIEDQEWDDFHVRLNLLLSEALTDEVDPQYIVRLARRPPSHPQERGESYLLIRELPALEVVTEIHSLSPTIKRPDSTGRAWYRAKRAEIVGSQINLVELDLLRGGERLPVIGLPAGGYYAAISRAGQHSRTDVYAWTLRESIPTIPIPLKSGDREVRIGLQSIFETAFRRADYSRTLNYQAPLRPPLSPEDAA